MKPNIISIAEPRNMARAIKVLGVTFDHQLKFSQNISETVVVRATQRLGALRTAFHLLTIPARLRAYKAFVRPVMEYCPIVWMGAASSHLNRLDWVQERAIKAIHPQCWLPSLIIRRTIAALCLLYKALCDNSPALLSRMAPPPTHQPRTTRLTRQAVRLSNRASPSVTECSSCQFQEQCEPSLSPLRHPNLEPAAYLYHSPPISPKEHPKVQDSSVSPSPQNELALGHS